MRDFCPCTYAWAEGLILWRDNLGSDRRIVLNLNTGDTLISADNLEFDTDGGLRAGLGIRTKSGAAWEFEYMGLFDEEASDSVAEADALALPGNLGLATGNFFFADEVSVHYESRINSAEVSRVSSYYSAGGQSVDVLYGFRYLNIHEDLDIFSNDFQQSTSTYDVHTDNNLFGAQIGSRVRSGHGRWSFEGTGKAGVYGNDAEQHAGTIVDFPAFVVRPGRSASEGDVAFVGDLNFNAIYQLSRIWGVRAGYNVIWIDGVALAPDQLDFTNTPRSGKDISTDGGIFLHGVNVGLEARW